MAFFFAPSSFPQQTLHWCFPYFWPLSNSLVTWMYLHVWVLGGLPGLEPSPPPPFWFPIHPSSLSPFPWCRKQFPSCRNHFPPMRVPDNNLPNTLPLAVWEYVLSGPAWWTARPILKAAPLHDFLWIQLKVEVKKKKEKSHFQKIQKLKLQVKLFKMSKVFGREAGIAYFS